MPVFIMIALKLVCSLGAPSDLVSGRFERFLLLAFGCGGCVVSGGLGGKTGVVIWVGSPILEATQGGLQRVSKMASKVSSKKSTKVCSKVTSKMVNKKQQLPKTSFITMGSH